jgi:hypothetical protein
MDDIVLFFVVTLFLTFLIPFARVLEWELKRRLGHASE